MLEFQNTKKAVYSPGGGSHYFDGLTLATTPLQNTHEFSQTNAWWLAELSRVVYRLSVTEGGMVRSDRRTVLQNAGIAEVKFSNIGETQATIVSAGGFHVLAFRGTESPDDWLKNVNVLPRSWDGPGKVHSGFLEALDNVWSDIRPVLLGIRGPVFYTGHSLGAAIAVVAAARIDAARRPLAVYTYGGPRCGDTTFAKQHPLCDRVYRVVNNRDMVPLVPLGYEHTGELRYITSDKRLLRNPATRELALDRLRDDDTHTLMEGVPPEQVADHAPVNYVAWMQRFADANWVRRFGGR